MTVTGQYYLYLPAGSGIGESTGFYRATPQVTLTIPSTAAKVITVGAYDQVYDTYADFSRRQSLPLPFRGRSDPCWGSGRTVPEHCLFSARLISSSVYSSPDGKSIRCPPISRIARFLRRYLILWQCRIPQRLLLP